MGIGGNWNRCRENGNENEVLDWELVGMGMISHEWEEIGTIRVIAAHL